VIEDETNMTKTSLVRAVLAAALGTCASIVPFTVLAQAPLPPSRADHAVILGQIAPFTGYPLPYGREVNQGIRACLERGTSAQGTHGKKISFFELDDGYSANTFVEQFRKAKERRAVALLAPVGSEVVKRLLSDKLLDANDIVIINALPGAESFRNPGHPMLFHVRAGDKQQIEKIVNHVKTLGMSKLAVMYQDLPIGVSGMQVAQAEANRAGGLELLPVKASPAASALVEASARIASLDAPGVLILGAPNFMVDGVVALRRAKVHRSLFVLSYAPHEAIVSAAGTDAARGVGIAQTFPDPNGKRMLLQKDFQAAMASTFPRVKEYTSAQLEGCVTARVAIEGLRRTGGSPAPAMLSKALHEMGDVDLGGFRIDFSKGNVGSTFVDIAVIGADGKLRY
jgi:ABC-type branched-subunit amino acid transport system substrate-binding protein